MNQFRLFNRLLSIGILSHLSVGGSILVKFPPTLVAFFALLLFIRPAHPWIWHLLLVSILIDAVDTFPNLPNHWLFMASLALTLVTQSVLEYNRSKKPRSETTKPDFQVISFWIKVHLSILYFFAGFHKLNSGFFSYETSCITQFYRDYLFPINEWYPSLSPQVFSILALTVVVSEISLAVLIWIPKLQTVSLVCIAYPLHLVLGWAGFHHFSLIMFSLLYAALPPIADQNLLEIAKTLHSKKTLTQFRERFQIRGKIDPFYKISIAIFLFFVFELFLPKNELLWTGIMSILFLVLVLSLFLPNHSPPMESFKTQSAWKVRHLSWCFPILLVFNGMMPYFGLKTTTAFSMFSNLQTEGSNTNHFLIKERFLSDRFRYQDELLEIIDSTDPYLKSLSIKGQLIPLIEIRRYLTDRLNQIGTVDEEVIFRYREQEFVTQIAKEPDPFLMANLNLIERRLLDFRTVSTQNRCQW